MLGCGVTVTGRRSFDNAVLSAGGSMRVYSVVADEVGTVPLLKQGELAKIRLKFAVIDDCLVYGDVRSHNHLFKWLLIGPLSDRLPRDVHQAAAVAENLGLFTAAGNVLCTGEIETTIVYRPPGMTTIEAEQLFRSEVANVLLDESDNMVHIRGVA